MGRSGMWAVGVLACLWLATAHAQALGPRETKLVERAEKLLVKGHRPRALQLLRQAQLRAPSDVPLTLRLVELLLPDPQPPKAPPSVSDAALQQALALLTNLTTSEAPLDAAQQRNHAELLAWAHALQGDFSAAVYGLRERGSLGDTQVTTWLRRVAALAIWRGDLDAAEEAVRAARRMLPEDDELMGDLASILLAQGRTEEALPLFEARFARDPSQLSARRDLAGAWLAAGKPSDAYTLLEAEREACDAAEHCALEAARAALEMGEPQLAVTRLAADFAGDGIEALFLLADAHLRLGAKARARKAYEQILRERPGHPRALENLRALDESAPESHGP